MKRHGYGQLAVGLLAAIGLTAAVPSDAWSRGGWQGGQGNVLVGQGNVMGRAPVVVGPRTFSGTRVFVAPGGFVGPRLFWRGPPVFAGGVWYRDPYAYGYPYYAYAPPVVAAAPPPVYVQPDQPPEYWYYCQSPQGYYPYVQHCPQGWIQVVPQPGLGGQ
ncbi:MAG: hypothetical protein ACREMG_06645 [Gemmatimonadales bacterium]